MYLLDNFSIDLLNNYKDATIFFEKVTIPEILSFFELNDYDKLYSTIKSFEYDKIVCEQLTGIPVDIIRNNTMIPIIKKTPDPIVLVIAQYVGVRSVFSYSTRPEDCPIQYWMLFQNYE